MCIQLAKHAHGCMKWPAHYFREYYPELNFAFNEDKMQCTYPYAFCLKRNFYQFIGALQISEKGELDSICNDKTFSSLRTVRFVLMKLTKSQIKRSRNIILKNVDVELSHIKISRLNLNNVV